MADGGATNVPWAVPQLSRRSREQGAYVRLQGRRSSRRRAIDKQQGQSNEHDVRSTIALGTVVFGYFLPKQKVARSPKANGTAFERDVVKPPMHNRTACPAS
jgi:hypothetical protein